MTFFLIIKIKFFSYLKIKVKTIEPILEIITKSEQSSNVEK